MQADISVRLVRYWVARDSYWACICKIDDMVTIFYLLSWIRTTKTCKVNKVIYRHRYLEGQNRLREKS